MSEIRLILDRFLKYAQKNFPEEISNLNPGLSREYILSISQNWPVQLPHEVYELYQWRNGCGDGSVSCFFCLFDIWGFFPLEKVILQKHPYSYENEARFNINYPLNTLELFFGLESFLVGYLVFDEKGKTKWIELGEMSDGFFKRMWYYTSLANMVLTITESYETGAYYKDSRGIWKKSDDKYNIIWQKYNSDELSEAALKQLYHPPSFQLINQLIRDILVLNDPKKDKHLAQLIETINIHTSDKDIKEITTRIINKAKIDSLNNIYPLGSLFKEYWDCQNSQLSMFKKNLLPVEDFFILDILENPEENTKRAVAFLLFLLKAVDPLIELTTRHEAGWRRESAWALGQIGDIRATDVVNRLILDDDSYVREAAQSALIKLLPDRSY